MKVGYLGPHSSFSHDAAIKIFPKEELLPLGSVQAVFEKLEAGEVEKGVVPIENSTGGSVSQTQEELIDRNVFIEGEYFLKIEQCFLSNKPISEVKKIYSHSQGFAQCRNWIKKNAPKAELIELQSTSKAAQRAEKEGEGAIASESAAKTFGLKVIAKNISDRAFNKTRFILIGKKDSSLGKKISLIFAVKDSPGALFDAILSFKNHKINMKKIESRPSREKEWEYLFFVDIEGTENDKNVQNALAELAKHTSFIKTLGNYSEIK